MYQKCTARRSGGTRVRRQKAHRQDHPRGAARQRQLVLRHGRPEPEQLARLRYPPDKLRIGKVGTPVFKAPARFRKLRERARIYRALAKDVGRTKNRLNSLYRRRGVAVELPQIYDAARRDRWVRKLPTPMRPGAELLGRELDGLEELKAEANRAMQRAARRHRITRILSTVPGLGPVRVPLLMAIVVTPQRFRTKRQFWAYWRPRDRHPLLGRLGARQRAVGQAARRPTARPQPQPPSRAQGHLQGCGDDGDPPRGPQSVPGRLPASLRPGHQTPSREADGGEKDGRHRPGDVETRGGVRPRALSDLASPRTHPRRRTASPSRRTRTGRSFRRLVSRGSIHVVAWPGRSGRGPLARLCPLSRPNDVMALKAPMEAWSGVPRTTTLRTQQSTRRRATRRSASRATRSDRRRSRDRRRSMPTRASPRGECGLDNAFHGSNAF